MRTTDPYEVLGVKRTATREAVEKAFRAQIMSAHPDLNPDDPDATGRAREIISAYKTLSNDSRRRTYDLARLADIERAANIPYDCPTGTCVALQRLLAAVALAAVVGLLIYAAYFQFFRDKNPVYRVRVPLEQLTSRVQRDASPQPADAERRNRVPAKR